MGEENWDIDSLGIMQGKWTANHEDGKGEEEMAMTRIQIAPAA